MLVSNTNVTREVINIPVYGVYVRTNIIGINASIEPIDEWSQPFEETMH